MVSSRRPEQPRVPFPHLTNVVPVAPMPNPNDPIQTAFQQKMLDTCKVEDQRGLVYTVYEEANEKQRSAATKARHGIV